MNSQAQEPSCKPSSQAHPIGKIPSGITGLDEILRGGFPKGRATLLSGGPGTGKSMLALEFLYRGAQADRPGILVTFEERAEIVRRNARARGWDLGSLEQAGKLFLLEARLDHDAILAGTFNIKSLLAIAEGRARQMKATCIVIDAVDVFMRIFNNHQREREELYRLHDWLLEMGFTALITSKHSGGARDANGYDFLDYMVDCVVILDQRVEGQLTTRRLRVAKYRGSGHAPNECPFIITPCSAVVMPVSETSLDYPSFQGRVSTGIAEMDTLIGGGYWRGGTILVTGATGAGKTTMACSFVGDACKRGEKVLYLSFEESVQGLVSNMLSPGIDLRPAMEAGTLSVVSRMPESTGVEEHLCELFQWIEDFEPDHIIVDAISACHRMGSERAAFDYLVRLIHLAKRQAITLMVINQLRTPAESGDMSDFRILSLIDTILMLRYCETQRTMDRQVRIYKNRGAKHLDAWYLYSITDDGVVIAGPARSEDASENSPEHERRHRARRGSTR